MIKNNSIYLVTGGCGFIGSHLVEALLKLNHKVIVLDNLTTGKKENISSEVELIIGDIRDEELVNKIMHRVDGCFHLAANVSIQATIEDWVGTHEVNLTGTIIVFNAAKQGRNNKPIPVVYASSTAVYGNSQNLPLKENERVIPLSGYGADKLGCELHGQVGWGIHRIPNIGLRFFNVYGPRQNSSSVYAGVISIFLNELNAGKNETIFGDGEQTRDFVYIKDAVYFLTSCMEKLEYEHSFGSDVFNVCTGHATSINDLAESLKELTHEPSKIIHLEKRLGDVQYSVGDPIKALNDLGLKTKYSLIEGLKEFIHLK